jgi:hypothetical protein
MTAGGRFLTRGLNKVKAETALSVLAYNILRAINLVGASGGALYDPEIWDEPGFTLVLSWLAQKWQRKCCKLAPRGSKNPEQYLTKEQQQTCLDSAAAELIREIRQQRPLN